MTNELLKARATDIERMNENELEDFGGSVMRKQYTKIGKFTVIATHEDEKLTGFFIADNNGEKLSNRTFAKASEAIEYGYELMESKRLLNE